MKQMGTSSIVAAAALAASVFMSSAAGAAPAASSTQALAQQADSNVQVVRDGRGHGRHHGGGWRGHRHRGHGGWGWGAAALGAGLLLSAPYAYGGYDDDDYAGYDEGYRGRYAGSGGEARCEATFRSYDPSSGTYMGYDGVRRACPYL